MEASSSSPYFGYLVLLAVVVAALVYLIQQAQANASSERVIVTAEFASFQRNYCRAFLCALACEWLQNSHLFVLLRTRVGQATRAVSDNPALAAASGIDVDRIVRGVWTIAAALAGLGGILYALVVSNGIRQVVQHGPSISSKWEGAVLMSVHWIHVNSDESNTGVLKLGLGCGGKIR